MAGLKRGARKKTYGIGALALIAMPGVLGTPYPASMVPTNHIRLSSGHAGAVENLDSAAQVRTNDGIVDGEL
jgi:hypothetical protein